MSLKEVVAAYNGLGYTFIAVTDHNIVAEAEVLESSFVNFCGIEVDYSGKYHTCIIATHKDGIIYDTSLSHQELLRYNSVKGNLVILNHPNWSEKEDQFDEHYTIEDLLSSEQYSGIEIYNSKIETENGSPLSTAKWDVLLSAGKRVLGFANQDAHDPSECVDCCNVVNTRSRDATSIFRALRNGCFYCFYGVKVKSVGRNGEAIFIDTVNAECIRFVTDGGRVLEEVNDCRGVITFEDYPGCSYIRIECLAAGNDISWTQPFFRT